MLGTRIAVSGRRRFAAFSAAVAVSALCALTLLPTAASAATDVKAKLSLTGVVNSDNPTGGSVVGAHPGDTVVFSASTLATADTLLGKVGLDGLVGNLLDSGAKLQVKADFAGLPGGKKSTVLSGTDTKSFTLPIGKYPFTWTAQKVTVGILGTSILPITLDGNQLKSAGVKLNAKNQYVGTLVVAKDPPKGGIGLQLPGVSVQPSLPIVGTLPKITLPGVTTPTLPVSVPDLNPNKGTSSGNKSTKPSSSSGGGATQRGALAVPAMVVPQGTGKVLGDTSGYPADSVDNSVPVAGNSDQSIAPIPGTTTKSGSSAKAPARSVTENSAGKGKTIDLASNNPSSSGLPVVLAMIAVLALVLVAGAYARLYLLRKQS